MLIRDAEIAGERLDVRLDRDRVVEIGVGLAAFETAVLDAAGGALLPGLHDHHLHLRALAAALASVRCGPPAVEDREDLARALGDARARDGWIRGTGYFESVAGELDRTTLDALRDDVAIRVQHRSGVMWFLNSRAIEALDLEDAALAGVERDERGRATGRLFRADAWLRERVPPAVGTDLAAVGRRLAARGVTGVTDCTPTTDAADRDALAAARASGALPQKLELMGVLGLRPVPGLSIGAHKIMLDEPALPAFDSLVERIRAAHDEARGVAFHAVTRAELLFALAALESAGARPGDRVEHASVAPEEACQQVQALGVTIVTQPNFVGERGDAYRQDVDERDRPHLYRVRSWIERGVPLRFGTDAPFGEADPWAALEAAVDRRTPSGATLGGAERVKPESALARFLPDADERTARPGPPRVAVGDVADLCLLDRPWGHARAGLGDVEVTATWIDGRLVQRPGDPPANGLHRTSQSGHRRERRAP